MTEISAWIDAQLRQHLFAGEPTRLDVVFRLVCAYRSLRKITSRGSVPPNTVVFGFLLPVGIVPDAAYLANKARGALLEWVAAMDPTTRAELAARLEGDLLRDLGLRDPTRETHLPSARLIVEVEVEVIDLDEMSQRFERVVTEAAVLMPLAGASPLEVQLEHLPFTASFPEIISFDSQLFFHQELRRLALRGHFALDQLPEEDRGADLMEAIARGMGDAPWHQAGWRDEAGRAIPHYLVQVTTNVLRADLHR